MTAPPLRRPPRTGVQASVSGPTTLWIFDDIGGSGVPASQFVENMRAAGDGPVDLFVNSGGGDLFDGLAIMEAIRRHPGHVRVFVDGLAASAASVLICAADEIVVSPSAMIMVHSASSMTAGNARDHRAAADVLDAADQLIADVYAARTGLSVAHWLTAMEHESWYPSADAVSLGLADRVGDAPKLESTTACLHMAFARTEHRPMAAGQISATIRASIQEAFGQNRPVRRPSGRRRPVPSPMTVLRELRAVYR